MANLLAVRDSPVDSAAALVIRVTPGALVESGHRHPRRYQDKPLLVGGVFVFLALVVRLGGSARRACLVAGGAAARCALAARGRGRRSAIQEAPSPVVYLPLAVGLVTWVVVLSLLADRLRAAGACPGGRATRTGRRGFLIGAAAVAVISVGDRRAWAASSAAAAARSRRRAGLLRLTGVTEPRVPPAARIRPGRGHAVGDARGGLLPDPHRDRAAHHRAGAVAAAVSTGWSIVRSRSAFRDLIARERTQAWVTLNCVSNPVGGDLIGNAWWSGASLADLLDEAGVRARRRRPAADLRRLGWTCGTPLSAVMDGRDAMLAVAMNGSAADRSSTASRSAPWCPASTDSSRRPSGSSTSR